MEKTLKQDEIDALFEAARSTTPSRRRPRCGPTSCPTTFPRAGQISTTVARHQHAERSVRAQPDAQSGGVAAHAVSGQPGLRRADPVQSEFLLRIPEISYVASVRLEPLGALSVLQLDLALAPPIIDLLLGGDGKDGPLRELTDIEESILGSVVEIDLPRADRGLAAGGIELQLRAPPDADPGGAHYGGDREDALPELRDPHAAQRGAEPGLSGGGGEHHPAPAVGERGRSRGLPRRSGGTCASAPTASRSGRRCNCRRCASPPAPLKTSGPGKSSSWAWLRMPRPSCE